MSSSCVMSRKCGWALCLAVLTAVAMCCAPSAVADTLLVPEVYATIGDALLVAGTGDIISIAPGLYRESNTVDIDGVILESRLQEATTATTIITGQNLDPPHRPWVFFVTGSTGPTTEIRHLTITGTDWSVGPAGGIVVDSGSDVTIRDNIITDNDNGGISGETAGGICCLTGSSATIRNNTITGNYGYNGGGAVYCGDDSIVVIEDNILNGNSSRYWGAAVHCGMGSNVLIQRNEIVDNHNAEYSGGGIYTEGSMCNILGNYIAENGTAGGTQARGAGIAVDYSGTAFIANNIIANNTVTGASGRGGGIYVGGVGAFHANAAIINNTIYGNEAASGSAIHIGSSTDTITITNNIAVSGLVGCAFTFDEAVTTADYNDLWNNPSDCNYEGFAVLGPHDLAVDPLFLVYPPVLPIDFDLQPTSLCIDAGTNDGAPADDYLQRPRPHDGDDDDLAITDIGAFEFQETPVSQVLLDVHPNERAPGLHDPQFLGGDPWTQPTLSAAGSYWWKYYVFSGSDVLWIQLCAQCWDKNQSGYGDDDNLLLEIDGVRPPDYDGIQTGTGSWQWRGDKIFGKRHTYRFLHLAGAPGIQKHQLSIGADESPVLWWIKVTDLEPGVIEVIE